MGQNSASRPYGPTNVPSRYTSWERWWAWFPVTTISGQRVWFSWCYRRVAICGTVMWETHDEEFGTIFDVLNHTGRE